MVARRIACRRGWPALLAAGYLLFYAVHFAEWAYCVPRMRNADYFGMVLAVLRWTAPVAPIRWFALGPCQHHPHLGLALFVPAVLLLGLGYLGALRAVQRRPEAWPLSRLLRCSALAALPLLLLLPPTSVDYLAYFFAGRAVSVYHVSPWRHSLAEFPHEFRYLLPQVWGSDLKCIYGPVWVGVMAAIMAAVRWVAPGDLTPGSFFVSVLLLRAANATALLAAALAVWKIQGRLWPRQQRLVTAALLFNPLLVYESLGALHNDLWGIALALWACYLFLQDDIRFAALLALAMLTKCTIVAMAPFIGVYYWRRHDWTRLSCLALATLLSLSVTQLLGSEYLSSRVSASAGYFEVSAASLPQFFGFLLAMARPAVSFITWTQAVSQLMTLMLGAITLRLLWRTHTREQVIAHTLWALGLYLSAVYLQTMPWYFVWPLGLLCATRWTRATPHLVLASTAILLSYVMYFWNHNGWTAGSQRIGFLLTIAAAAPACLAAHRARRGTCELPAEAEVGISHPASRRNRPAEKREKASAASRR